MAGISEKFLVANYVWLRCIRAFEAGELDKAKRLEAYFSALEDLTEDEFRELHCGYEENVLAAAL